MPKKYSKAQRIDPGFLEDLDKLLNFKVNKGELKRREASYREGTRVLRTSTHYKRLLEEAKIKKWRVRR
jgi:hypothetical protein